MPCLCLCVQLIIFVGAPRISLMPASAARPGSGESSPNAPLIAPSQHTCTSDPRSVQPVGFPCMILSLLAQVVPLSLLMNAAHVVVKLTLVQTSLISHLPFMPLNVTYPVFQSSFCRFLRTNLAGRTVRA